MERERCNQEPLRMPSNTAIRSRLLVLCFIGILAVWANYENEIVVINGGKGELGGKMFDSLIGNDNALAILTEASEFAQKLLYANGQIPVKPVQQIVLSVDNYTTIAATEENVIHVSCKYIEDYVGDVDQEFRGLIFREMGRVWQWNGRGKAPRGLVDGIAEYVRLLAGLSSSKLIIHHNRNNYYYYHDAPRDRWDGGGQITALFLEYCESLRVGFVADLNAKMEKGWDEGWFEELLGRNASQLWSTYKQMPHLHSLADDGTVPSALL